MAVQNSPSTFGATPVTDIGANIAKNLRARRLALGMSLEDVAKAAGTSKSHIWAMEQGKNPNPTIRMILSVAEALRTNLNDLLGFDVSEPKFTEQELELISVTRRIFGSEPRP